MTTVDYEALERADAVLPAGPWQLWTSCSYRRIGGPDGHDGDVLHAYRQRSDGQPDLSMPEDQLAALVELRNQLPAVLADRAADKARIAELEAGPATPGALPWEAVATEALQTVETRLPPVVRQATETLYAEVLESIQDYFADNVRFNIGARLRGATAQAQHDRQRAEDLAAENERLRELLAKSGRQFRFYEDQHRAKSTPEADKKAEVNAELAAEIERALEPRS